MSDEFEIMNLFKSEKSRKRVETSFIVFHCTYHVYGRLIL